MSFGFEDDAGGDPLSQFVARGRRRAAYQALSPDAAGPATESLLQRGLSGVGYVGSTLDKVFGARAVRGLIDTVAGSGEHPEEILSFVPFSDTVGLTNAANVPSGAELSKRVTGYDPSQGNWLERNLVGPGIEMALDPSTYLGGIGALTRAGKLAKSQGALTKGFLESVRAGERTAMHGLTGSGVASALEGVGDLGTSANSVLRQIPHVARAEDALAAAGRKGLAWERALLSPEHGFVPVPEIQESFRTVKRPGERAGMVDLKTRYADLANREAQLVADYGQEPVARFLRLKAEGVDDPSFYNQWFAKQQHPEIHQLADEYRGLSEQARAMERAAGYESPGLLDDEIAHTARHRGDLGAGPKADFLGRQRAFDYSQGKQRLDALKHLAGGTAQIEDLVHDPRLAGAARTFTDPQVAEEIVRQNLGSSLTPGALPGVDYSILPQARARAEETAGFLKGVDTSKLFDEAGKAIPYFSPNVLQSQTQRLKRAVGTSTSADTLYDVLGKTAQPLGEGMRPVSKVLSAVGLDTEQGMQRALEAIGVDPGELAQALAAAPDMEPVQVLQGLLAGHGVSNEVGQGLTDLLQRYTTAHELAGPGKLASDLLGAFKRGAYTIWPSSQIRNLASGRYQNLVDVGMNPLSKSYGIAQDVLQAKPVTTQIPGLAHLAPELQSQELRKLAFAHGVIGEPQGMLAEGVTKAEPFSTNPLAARPTLGQDLSQLKADVSRPGWKAPWQQESAPARFGQALNSQVENNLRMGEFTELLRKGWTPEAAAQQVRSTHFDYSSMGSTPFIQNKINPLLTFPTFSRHNIPKQVGLAITNPARQSAPIRFSGAMNQDDQSYVPQYMQSGLAIPLPGDDLPEGTQRYLTRLGLPVEEAFGHVQTGRSSWQTAQKTAQNFLSMLNPLIKAPLEWATGTQLHTGKALQDLYPGPIQSLGGVLPKDAAVAATEALGATPASRIVSTLNRLMDERKMTPQGALEQALGLTTGLKTTDVDVDKWRAIDTRNALTDLLAASPRSRTATDVYIPREERANMTPQEAALVQRLGVLKKEARKEAQAKRVGVR